MVDPSSRSGKPRYVTRLGRIVILLVGMALGVASMWIRDRRQPQPTHFFGHYMMGSVLGWRTPFNCEVQGLPRLPRRNELPENRGKLLGIVKVGWYRGKIQNSYMYRDYYLFRNGDRCFLFLKIPGAFLEFQPDQEYPEWAEKRWVEFLVETKADRDAVLERTHSELKKLMRPESFDAEPLVVKW